MLIKDIKLAVLKKIDSQIKNTAETRITRDYINTFVSALNRGLQDLATTGKYIIKSYPINQDDINNILPMPLYKMDFVSHYTEPIIYEANATSYYFEVDGIATITFTIDGVEVLKLENTHLTRQFTAFKGFIPNEEKRPVKMEFGGLYSYNIRNVAMYEQPFNTEEDIWDFVSEKRYNLRLLTTDFYKLSNKDIVFQSGFSTMRYTKTEDYYFEGDSTLVLNGLQRGTWIVHYYAYPQYIPEDVADDFDLELDPEVMQLLIIYVASELIFGDDRPASGAWRNHYEAGKELLNPVEEHSNSEFIDLQGW